MDREQVKEYIALEYHLLYNCYPPPPRNTIALAQKAIEMWDDGFKIGCLKLEDFELESNDPESNGYVSVMKILDDWHLWGFVRDDDGQGD